ncbi:hypothetical protein JW992_04195, partial [candidate division KSB1 bacterium]|nr:hypothetical protein [candidate division KSB1 bacterium]
MQQLFLLCILAFLTLSPAQFTEAAAQKQEKKSFPVVSGGLLTVESDLGSISVTTHAIDEIHVLLEYDGDNQSINTEYEKDGKNLRIVTTVDRNLWDRITGCKLHYDIRVPRSYNLDLSTAGGGIDIADLQGRIDAATSGGSLTFG